MRQSVRAGHWAQTAFALAMRRFRARERSPSGAKNSELSIPRQAAAICQSQRSTVGGGSLSRLWNDDSREAALRLRFFIVAGVAVNPIAALVSGWPTRGTEGPTPPSSRRSTPFTRPAVQELRVLAVLRMSAKSPNFGSVRRSNPSQRCDHGSRHAEGLTSSVRAKQGFSA